MRSVLRSYWKQNLRVSARTFEQCLDWFTKHETNMRETIPVVKRVAVSLWQLDTGDFYQSATLTFRIGKSTAVTIKDEFCDVICERSDELIHLPENVQEMRDEILNFSIIPGLIYIKHPVQWMALKSKLKLH